METASAKVQLAMSLARSNCRRQLTLFVPDPVRSLLEAIRAQLDPVQSRLIPAHVTLCREDELEARAVTELGSLRGLAGLGPVTLHFGLPEVFDGHGVRLPCVGGEAHFHRLRSAVLGSENIRVHRAHITLAHPRNPRAAKNRPSTYASLTAPLSITFSRLSPIVQHGVEPWQVGREIDLAGSEA